MKVKIQNKWYNSEEIPILVLFEQSDKENIVNMASKNYKYCSYPNSGWTKEQIEEFMEIS